ncbi:MAG: hypothetical protein O7C39_09030 [Bacteroidetes bacterium]|nr:hypothetical protein [Bacteroidota bacterium]
MAKQQSDEEKRRIGLYIPDDKYSTEVFRRQTTREDTWASMNGLIIEAMKAYSKKLY